MDDEKFFTLGDKAEILRCQLPRRKIAIRDLVMGLLPDGQFLCREVTASDIDALTGLAELDRDEAVELKHTARGEKYLLRENDIVFVFAGVERSLALTGLITSHEEPALPGRSLCVIRAHDIDPVWLFYRLRMRQTRRELAKMASRTVSPTLTINLEELRQAKFAFPSPREIGAARTAHSLILEEAALIHSASNQIALEQARVNYLFASREAERLKGPAG